MHTYQIIQQSLSKSYMKRLKSTNPVPIEHTTPYNVLGNMVLCMNKGCLMIHLYNYTLANALCFSLPCVFPLSTPLHLLPIVMFGPLVLSTQQQTTEGYAGVCWHCLELSCLEDNKHV
jgi:hypothetical protein